MSEKKELVWDAFSNKPTSRTPVGFWFHYTQDEIRSAYENPEMREQNISGHKNFVKSFKPDFVKLMSDGYFFEPETTALLKKAASANDLKKIKPIEAGDKWIRDQVSLVKELTATFGNEVLTFYNVFAPATSFKWAVGGDKKLAAFIKEDKSAVIQALAVLAQNAALLARAVIAEGGADGIYLSVQTIQDASVDAALYGEVVAPTELAVLTAANAAGGKNILHVCGYEGARNNLALFAHYPAAAVNFASAVEGVSLAEGKKIFGGKAVIGGFANTKDGVLYKGTKEEVQAEAKRLIAEAGRTGIILGADCTVPKDISFERLEWVREAAK